MSLNIATELLHQFNRSVETKLTGAEIHALADYPRDFAEINIAFQTAVTQGDCNTIKTVLNHWDSLAVSYSYVQLRSDLYRASCLGHVDVVELIINSKRLNFYDVESAFHGALRCGKFAAAENLRRGLRDLQVSVNSPIMLQFDEWHSFDTRIQKAFPDRQLKLKSLYMACIGDLLPEFVQAHGALSQVLKPVEIAHINVEVLNEAIRLRAREVLRFLGETTSFTDIELLQAFFLACSSTTSKTVECLLELGGYNRMTADFLPGLIIASGQGNLGIVQHLICLLESQQLIQATINSSLNIASLKGHAPLVEYLLQKGAQSDLIVAEPTAPTRLAQSDWPTNGIMEQPEYQRTSLEAAMDGFSLSQENSENLEAESKGFYSSWENSASLGGWREAPFQDREATVRLLLAHGADPRKSHKAPLTLLYTTVEYCSVDIISALIDAGMEIRSSLSISSTENRRLMPSESAVVKKRIIGYEHIVTKNERGSDIDHVRMRPSRALLSKISGNLNLESNSTCSSPASVWLLEVAARREVEAVGIIHALIRAGAEFPDPKTGTNPGSRISSEILPAWSP